MNGVDATLLLKGSGVEKLKENKQVKEIVKESGNKTIKHAMQHSRICGPLYWQGMKVTVLCLLASLCLWPVKSELVQLQVTCQHEVTSNNSYKWNNTLATCQTLQIICTERQGKGKDNKLDQIQICNSFEECGVTRPPKLVEKLYGNISCTHQSDKTECQLFLLCNQTIHLCENKDCELDHILTGDNRICKFYHNITKCIQTSGNFEGDIDCNRTTGQQDYLSKLPDCNTDDDSNYLAAICLGWILAVLFLTYIIIIGIRKGWKTLNIFQKQDVQSNREEDVQLRNLGRDGEND